MKSKKFEFVAENSGVVLDTTNEDTFDGLNATLFEPSVPVQNYIKDENDYFLGYNNTDAPYLDTKENGYSVGYRYRAGKHLTLNYGFEAPMQISDNDFEGKNTMYAMSGEYLKGNYKHTFITGRTFEPDSFLETEASGIFEMSNLETEHNFMGLKSEFKLGNSMYLKGSYSSAISTLNYSYSSLIESATELVSDNFELAIAKDFDKLGFKTVLSISQPNRIQSGTLSFNQPSLATLNGDIYYDKKDVSLKPSGRQIDLGIGFVKDINEDGQIITKFTVQDEYNHNKNNDMEFGISILGKYKDFKLGYMYNSFDDSSQFKLNYEKNF